MLRDRISRLSAASLRINASLDLGTVLREVVESARGLTGARYGLIAALEESGQIQDFVISGLTAEAAEKLVGWPEGPKLFEHFRDLEGVLRLRDLPAYVRSLGYSPDPRWPKIFQGTPMRHQGLHVGNFFLAEKEGGGEVHGRGRRGAGDVRIPGGHGDRQRPHAQGGAAGAGRPGGPDRHFAGGGGGVRRQGPGKAVSLNREAKRIVGSLRSPGQKPEQLLEIITWRHADGREFSMEEFPMAQVVSNAATVRAEEIVIEVPDGRSVTMLVNATPIRSEDGAVESMIVHHAGPGPAGRARAGADRVSEHGEPRASGAADLDQGLKRPRCWSLSPPPDPAEMLQFFRIVDEQADQMRGLISDLLDAGRIEAGTLSVSAEPSEVAGLVDRARNTFLSGGSRHTVLIDLPPDLPQVMADRRRLVQVLNNLFANASRHAPESSPIRVAAEPDGVHVAISVSDGGRGVSPDRLPHLFRKHSRVGMDKSGTGGSGLGLSICKGLVEAHGGRIRAESGGVGMGTRITFTIPVAEEAVGGAYGLARSLAHPPRKGKRKTRILVVDDDPQTLRYVRGRLGCGGLFATGDRRPAGSVSSCQDEEAPTGSPGHDAARHRRDRTDGNPPRDGRSTGDFHFSLRPGRDHRPGAGHGGRRLHRQAVLTHGAGGESPGSPAQAGRTAGTLPAGGSGH